MGVAHPSLGGALPPRGMKAVEYRIWARSYIKHKGDALDLAKIQLQLQQLRNRHKL